MVCLNGHAIDHSITLRVVLASIAIVFPGAYQLAHATGWQIVPTAGLGVLYTDNVALVPENEEDESITELLLGISARRDGGRLSADVNYGVQGLAYDEHSERDDVFHNLDANATLEVSHEQFFIDANSSISQQAIDPQRGIAGDNISLNSNRFSVFTAAIEPRFQRQIGPSLQLQANYQTAVVHQLDSDSETDTSDVDSTQKGGSVSLGNIADEHLPQWLIEYSQTRADSDNGSETKHEQTSLNLFYPLTRSVLLIGLIGYERNNYDRHVESVDPDGSYWEAGVEWQAGPRDRLELRHGRRYFDETNSLEWIHQGKRLAASISYGEDITTVAQTLLDGDGSDLTRVNRETAISKRLDAELSVTLPKSAIGISVFETRNEFQTSLEEDKIRGGKFTWQWNIARRTQIDFNLLRQRGEFINDTQKNDIQVIELQISKHISSVTTSNITYTHTQFDSDLEIDEYEANTLEFRIERSF